MDPTCMGWLPKQTMDSFQRCAIYFSCASILPMCLFALSIPMVIWQVNISLIVNDSEAEQCVRALHSTFFEQGVLSELDVTNGFHNASTNHCGTH